MNLPSMMQPARRWRALVLAGAATAVGLLVAACGSATPQVAVPAASQNAGSTAAGGSQATQSNEGGQVTIDVTWSGVGAGPVFQVVMNTHSVDLDAVDLRQLVTLRVDGGAALQPAGWDAPKGGHHRSGTLTFPASTADGSPTIGPGSHTIDLVIRDVAGVAERAFQWRS